MAKLLRRLVHRPSLFTRRKIAKKNHNFSPGTRITPPRYRL